MTAEMTLIPSSSSCMTSSQRLRCRARHVGVRQLVDDRDLRLAANDRVDVHLLERDAAILDPLARYDFEVADLRLGLGAPVRLDEADDDVDAATAKIVRFVEHAVGLCRRPPPSRCRA